MKTTMVEGIAGRTRAARAGWRRLPDGVRAAVVAFALACFLFPEVVFAGGSFSMIRSAGAIDARSDIGTVALRPDLEDRAPHSGMRDVGSQVWQFEATTRHMRNVVRDGQDPAWNPWTASGQRGPETLVGMQLSPVVLAIAAAGASVTAFTFVLFALVVVALWCLQRFATVVLGGPRLAGVGAGLVFVLNGFATGFRGGLVVVPYLLFPLVLYTLARHRQAPGPARLLAATGAHVALLTSTFLPGVVLVLVAVHATALALAVGGQETPVARRWRAHAIRAVRALGAQAVPVVVAIGVAAVVLVPIAVALANAGPDMDGYADRDYRNQDLLEYLTVLTPRHVFTAFLRNTFPDQVPVYSWTTHLGLVPLTLVAAAWRPSRGRDRAVLGAATAMVIIAIAVHLGTPVTALVVELPFGRSIGTSYWSSLAGMGLTVAVGVGVKVGRTQGWDLRAGLTSAAVMGSVLTAAVAANDPDTRSAIALALALGVLGGAGALLVGARRNRRRTAWVAGLVALLALELVSYQNPVHYERQEITRHLPAYTSYLRSELGDGRIMSAGAGAIPPEWGAALRIRQIETITHVQVPTYTVFFSGRIEGRRVNRFLRSPSGTQDRFLAQPEALDLLGVRFIVVHRPYRDFLAGVSEQYPMVFEDDDADITVFANTDAYPRARLAGRLVPSSAVGGQPRWSPTVTVSSDAALLTAARALGVDVGHVPAPDGGDSSPGTARITAESSTEVRVAVDSTRPGVLVLADTFHDDWHATVGGSDAPVGLVDETLRGVAVPAGQTEVVFRYRPVARDVGAGVSLASVAALAGTCTWWWWRRRRRAPALPLDVDAP